MGKHRRSRSWWQREFAGLPRWAAVGAGVTVVAVGAVLAALLVQQPEVDEQAIRDYNQRTAEETQQRLADESARREAALEAKRTTIAIPSDRALRVLAIGDSLSAGSYVTDEALVWHRLVADHLGQSAPVELTVEAVPGQRTAAAVERGVEAEAQDVVLVELGTNDVGNTEIGWFRSNYGALLEQVQQTSPDAAVVCLTPWQTRERAADYTAAITELCKGRATDISTIYTRPGMRILDGQPYFGGITPDNFHPGDRGHAAIAEAVTTWLVVSPVV